MLIEGDTYPPPNLRALLAQIVSGLKFLLIIAIVSGFDPAATFNVNPPSLYYRALQNKFYVMLQLAYVIKVSACLMLFFVGNMIENQLLSTGAFEIFLNDVPVWSKLDVGRVPQPYELFEIIDSHLNFNRVPR
ncbi:Rdx domain containing protein [Trichuris trichiura]|uniref:Rdx domain containing protein n=1 Tax=Trichuris trichiura TaxID=36087 RepID=A0A077Z2D6_TRITR|nr:Rdx domain containing protein [Trichuris trichiura]